MQIDLDLRIICSNMFRFRNHLFHVSHVWNISNPSVLWTLVKVANWCHKKNNNKQYNIYHCQVQVPRHMQHCCHNSVDSLEIAVFHWIRTQALGLGAMDESKDFGWFHHILNKKATELKVTNYKDSMHFAFDKNPRRQKNATWHWQWAHSVTECALPKLC